MYVRPGLLGLLTLAALVAISSLSIVAPPASASQPDPQRVADVRNIESVVIRAMAAKDTMFVTGQPVAGQRLGQSAIQALIANAQPVLACIYSPHSSLLARWEQLAQHGIAVQGSSPTMSRMVAGGIRNVVFSPPIIGGATATVHLTFTNWSTAADPLPNGSGYRLDTASNGIIEDVTLERGAYGWQITDDQFDFAPGSAP